MPWHGATKQPPALNRMKKSRVWQAIVPGTQNKPQDTLQIRKTPWHGVTKQPPAVPLPGPNVTPEPNEKIKGLAGNCSRHTKQATRHPSNQENTLARRDETASCRPSAWAKGSGRQLFQAHKTSHKTPFKSGKHLVACFVCLEQLPARPLIFSFGSGVTFGPGRGTAGGCFVTPCQGVFLI